MTEFEVKKTIELTDSDKEQILCLFKEVFDRNPNLNIFSNLYCCNSLGYSYHSLMRKNGVIVGHNAGMPAYYFVGGERKLFVCNISTMIEKHSRGIDNFFDLINNAVDYYRKEGVYMFYGFPNDNSYPLLTQLGLMSDIGKLDTYCLPYRIGGIKRSLKVFNPLSKCFCRCWSYFQSVLARSIVHSFSIEKDIDCFNEMRYKRGNGDYKIVGDGILNFSYRIIIHEKIQTCFLIDVWPKSSKSFSKAVRYLVKHERGRFDLLLYVGHLPFKHHGLIKIPSKIEPKHFHFTGFVLDSSTNKDLYNIDNWDVNLSNYDLI